LSKILIFGNFAEFLKIVKPLNKQQVRYIPTQENTGNIIGDFQNLKTTFENFYFFSVSKLFQIQKRTSKSCSTYRKTPYSTFLLHFINSDYYLNNGGRQACGRQALRQTGLR